jgi:hypothetical protein
MTYCCQQIDIEMTMFYHSDNRERLRAICRRERMSMKQCRDFQLAQQIPFPAILKFIGLPLHRNQKCFAHEGTTGKGTSLSFYPHKDNGHWMFHCNRPECGITGDQSEFWFQVVQRARLQPAGWCLPQACADLLARVESGEIDLSITEFEKAKSHSHGQRGGRAAAATAFSAGDGYWAKLNHLIKQKQEIAGRMRLPEPLTLKAKDVVLGLFPENRPLMLTNRKTRFHPIKLWDVWLAGHVYAETCGHVSQNYCCRCDVDGTSYDAFVGIERRWMVIEADHGTLEQQFWLHMQLAMDLGCLCWSGGKSLHGWYFVEEWTAERCFALYAKAIALGVNDCCTWLICTQARLPGGFNGDTGKRQDVLVWNL